MNPTTNPACLSISLAGVAPLADDFSPVQECDISDTTQNCATAQPLDATNIMNRIDTPTEVLIKYQVTDNRNYSNSVSADGQISLEALHFLLLVRELTASLNFRQNFIKKLENLYCRRSRSRNCIFNNSDDESTGQENLKLVHHSKQAKTWPSESIPNVNSLQFNFVVNVPVLEVHIQESPPPPIDERWCRMLNMSVQELSELDAWMSWLSTLGGACSALGDGSVRWADTAASISVRQMTIARRLGDPTIVARCRLYTAIACIQKHQYKMAATVVRQEHAAVLRLPQERRDPRLLKMCHGIWAKLCYERHMHRHAPHAMCGREQPIGVKSDERGE